MAWMDTTKRNRYGLKEQICWYCQKASGKCSWSHENIPIPGWNAEADVLNSQTASGRGIPTYRIYDCPEYEPGKEGEFYEKQRKRKSKKHKK